MTRYETLIGAHTGDTPRAPPVFRQMNAFGFRVVIGRGTVDL